MFLFNRYDVGRKFGEISWKIIEERNDYYREMEKVEKIYYNLSEKT